MIWTEPPWSCSMLIFRGVFTGIFLNPRLLSTGSSEPSMVRWRWRKKIWKLPWGESLTLWWVRRWRCHATPKFGSDLFSFRPWSTKTNGREPPCTGTRRYRFESPRMKVFLEMCEDSLIWGTWRTYHFFRQLWLVLGVKLMEINSNLFSGSCFFDLRL